MTDKKHNKYIIYKMITINYFYILLIPTYVSYIIYTLNMFIEIEI